MQKRFIFSILTACLAAACTVSQSKANASHHAHHAITNGLVLLAKEDDRATYYLPSSVKLSGKGLRTVALEIHDKNVEKGSASLIRQQAIVDCQRQLTNFVHIELLDANGKLLEAQDSEYPDFNTWKADEIQQAASTQSTELKRLIRQVCATK